MMFEVVVGAFLLVTTMGAVGSLLVANRRLQRVQNEHRVAQSEVSNHLERLTVGASASVDDLLQDLEVSAWARELLPTAEITSEVVEDEHGPRLRLTLKWESTTPVEVTGVAWFGRGADGSVKEEEATNGES